MSNAKRNENATRFTVNFFDQQIIGTQTSFNKASKGVGPEYEELTDKIAKHPEFELVVKEQKHTSTKVKRTYDGLDFPFMEAFIATQGNSESLIKEYLSVKAMAKKVSRKVYPFTKKWFLKKFGTEDTPFDMDEARKTISDYQIAMAVANAAKQGDTDNGDESADNTDVENLLDLAS